MKKVAWLFISAFIISCNTENLNTDNNFSSGTAELTFQFPSNSTFSIKNIPPTTDYIDLIIKGRGITTDKTLTKTIKKSEADPKTGQYKLKMEKLPIGNKEIEIKAFDSNKKLVAEGKDSIFVQHSKINTITIELKESKDTKVSPSAKPTSSSSPAITKDKTLNVNLKNILKPSDIIIAEIINSNGIKRYQEFRNKLLLLQEIPSGSTKIRLSLYENTGIPIAKASINRVIDDNNRDLNFDVENIDFPKTFEVEEPVKPNLGVTMAPVVKIMKDSFIEFPNNPPIPVNASTVKLFIDGIDTEFNKNVPVTATSTIKVEAKISLKDKANLRFIWGITELNTTKNKYETKILNDNDNIISRPIGSKPYFISLVATDFKSLSGPIVLPINFISGQ